jgi:hypothetical protein
MFQKRGVAANKHRASDLLSEDASIFVLREEMFGQPPPKPVSATAATDLHDSLVAVGLFPGFEKDVNAVQGDGRIVKWITLNGEGS